LSNIVPSTPAVKKAVCLECAHIAYGKTISENSHFVIFGIKKEKGLPPSDSPFLGLSCLYKGFS
jgi:hypothetical protein